MENRERIRARIVPDLLTTIKYQRFDDSYSTDEKFLELCQRIQGKEVNLVFTCGDAFEEVDDNYWLPDSCWTEIDDWVAKCSCGEEHGVTSERLGGTPLFGCSCGKAVSIYDCAK